MYHIYHTEGIILDERQDGEGSKYLTILSKDFGLIRAHAQGLRELKSKLRYSLQLFTHTSVNLVRGRYGWRIVSAKGKTLFRLLYTDQELRYHKEAVERILKLLRRLLVGEEKNEELFLLVLEGITLFEKGSIENKHVLNCEALLVMRILSLLGYWGSKKIPQSFLEGPFEESLFSIEPKRAVVVAEINKALKETQL